MAVMPVNAAAREECPTGYSKELTVWFKLLNGDLEVTEMLKI
ncbi:hypothetical protein [Paenibacillus sp. MER TA 81-3]|nr:hypothetical protein [Paenibacillus sp. MER TA 81-3]